MVFLRPPDDPTISRHFYRLRPMVTCRHPVTLLRVARSAPVFPAGHNTRLVAVSFFDAGSTYSPPALIGEATFSHSVPTFHLLSVSPHLQLRTKPYYSVETSSPFTVQFAVILSITTRPPILVFHSPDVQRAPLPCPCSTS